ncbi:50S ribosomal protein L25 [Planctomycetota bacterium]
MANRLGIEALERTDLGTLNSRRLRRKGLVPGVLYGKKRENVNLAFTAEELEQALRSNAHILDVQLPGGQSEPVMIKEVQVDSLSDAVLHVDFNRVDMADAIEVEVNIKLVGESTGVAAGGHLETARHSVTVQCLAGSIPDELMCDISDLGIDGMVRVADLKLPSGVKVRDDPGSVIVACKAPHEFEEEGAEEPEPQEPEVVTKVKKESEEE